VHRRQTFSEAITRWVGRRLVRWGVDADQYHFLLQASLKIDFRAPASVIRSDQPSQARSALKWTLVINLIFSVMMSLVTLLSASDTAVFSTVLLGYAMVMVGMSVLIEFGLAVISPDDFPILAHRPVSSRTFFAVKISNLLCYVLLLGASLNLAPAIAGLGCREAPWHFPLAYFTVASLASMFVGGATVCLYGLLLRTVHYERLKDLLVYAQIAFSFFIFFGYQLFPRVAGDVRAITITDLTHNWAVIFPPVWFACLTEVLLGNITVGTIGLATASLVALVVLVPKALGHVSLDYSEQIGRLAGSSAKSARAGQRAGKGVVRRCLNDFLLRDMEERAFFYFFLTMLRRNRLLKLQIYPNLGIVVAMMALMLFQTGHLENPFERPSFTFSTLVPAMGFVFGAMGVATALPFSDEYQGSWIFPAAPIRNRARILKAIKKVIFLFLFVPLFVLNLAFFAWLWPWQHALQHSLYALVIGLLALQLLLFLLRDFPFSRKLEKGAAGRQFVFTLIIFSLVGFAPVLSGFLARRSGLFLSVVAALFGLSLLLGRINNWRYARNTAVASY
jgi:ABC-2 type transport system permease protein